MSRAIKNNVCRQLICELFIAHLDDGSLLNIIQSALLIPKGVIAAENIINFQWESNSHPVCDSYKYRMDITFNNYASETTPQKSSSNTACEVDVPQVYVDCEYSVQFIMIFSHYAMYESQIYFFTAAVLPKIRKNKSYILLSFTLFV